MNHFATGGLAAVDWMAPNGSLAGGRIRLELEKELWSRYVDKVAASISDEFGARGIDSVLLKGPAIARWLYRNGPPRPYSDADLLVSPFDWRKAEAMLLELGFEKELGALEHPGMESFASESWVRGAETIDLHCTLWGLQATPEQVWGTLSITTEPMTLEGQTLRILNPEARTLVLATHAAKHGDGQPCVDLEIAVRELPLELWRRAAALAILLGGGSAFAAGMRLVPGGREIVRAIGLPNVPMPEATLRAWRVPMALGLDHLSQTPRFFPKLKVLFRELLPTPAFMRWWTPLARRGRWGLAASYVWRLLWVGRYAIPAFLAWRRARHEVK